MLHRALMVAVSGSLVLALAMPAAQAVPLLPGQSQALVGEAGPVGGTVLSTTGPVPYGAHSVTGTLTTTVIAGDASNPLGGLTLTYVLTNDADSVDSVGRLTLAGFAGLNIDASYQSPAAGLVPAAIDRSTAGNVIGFSFLGPPFGVTPLMPGTSTAVLVLQTDVQGFASGFAQVINGSVVGNIPILVPVPEPASLGLLVLSLTGLLRRRRV